MKVQLLCTKNGLKSGSLKRIASGLEAIVGYKVWRTTTERADRMQFRYGDMRNKLAQYEWFKQQGLSALEFTQSEGTAVHWIQQGNTVFGRKTLNGSEGHGIVIIDKINDLVDCPVYTKYKKKKMEFRVHIFKDKLVTIVEKRKKQDWEGPSDSRIRNLANGYVFCQELTIDAAMQKRVADFAVKCAKVTASDFKGVDLGYNAYNDDLFVIEVNSAPGIEGSNVDKYVQVIKEFI